MALEMAVSLRLYSYRLATCRATTPASIHFFHGQVDFAILIYGDCGKDIRRTCMHSRVGIYMYTD